MLAGCFETLLWGGHWALDTNRHNDSKFSEVSMVSSTEERCKKWSHPDVQTHRLVCGFLKPLAVVQCILSGPVLLLDIKPKLLIVSDGAC